jgi:N-carbamoylputrescine amidase
MQPITIALVQLAYSGSRQSMQAQYERLIAQAAAQGAGLVCLPEFSLTPYFPSSKDPSGFDWAEPAAGGPSDVFFSEQARRHGLSIISSIFERDGDRFYDTAVIHRADGSPVGITRKVHLPYGEGYNETDFFEPGDGYPIHDLGTLRLAAPTCYDQWFPEMARISALRGAEFIYYPTAIGSEPSDPDIDTADMWQTVMRGHAIANGIFIAAANRVGYEHPVRFYGSSFICDPMGKILAQAGRDTTEVISARLEPRTFEHWRELFPLLRQRRPETYARILESYEG